MKDRLSQALANEYEGKLIHLSGKMAGTSMSDKDFGVSASDVVGLKRRVEMFQVCSFFLRLHSNRKIYLSLYPEQWREREHEESREEFDQYSGQKHVTTWKEYSYEPVWSSSAISSHNFRHPERSAVLLLLVFARLCCFARCCSFCLLLLCVACCFCCCCCYFCYHNYVQYFYCNYYCYLLQSLPSQP